MSAKDARGTKRTCQNAECVARFYDLNRTPIQCPLCGALYAIASAPEPARVREKYPIRQIRLPAPVDDEVVAQDQANGMSEDAEAPAPDIAVAAGPPESVDETVLEEDDDAGDVSGIVDVPVEPGGRDV
jgi:uncharacterized protein (TIGR02300 family)